jgi:hypothetical protein
MKIYLVFSNMIRHVTKDIPLAVPAIALSKHKLEPLS